MDQFMPVSEIQRILNISLQSVTGLQRFGAKNISSTLLCRQDTIMLTLRMDAGLQPVLVFSSLPALTVSLMFGISITARMKLHILRKFQTACSPLYL